MSDWHYESECQGCISSQYFANMFEIILDKGFTRDKGLRVGILTYGRKLLEQTFSRKRDVGLSVS